MSLLSKIARNTFWQVVGKFFGTLLGLATIALITRYLGAEGFGFYTTAIVYLQFFGVLIDFGLQMTTAQMLAKPGVDQAKIFGNILSIRLISAVLFLGLGTGLVWFLPYASEVKLSVAIASFSFFFVALQSVLIGLYQKHLAMAEVAIAEIWGRLVLLIGVAVAVFYDAGLYPIVVSVSVGSLINFSLLYFKSKKYVRYRLAWSPKILKEVWQTAWPLAITISLSLVYFRADTIILSFFRPATDVGIYGSAYKVLEILVQFPYLFLGLVLPIMSGFYLSAKNLYHQTIQKSFDFLAIIAVPMVASVWVLSVKIMEFVAGPEFASASLFLSILIVAAALIYFGALFGYAIVAAGLQKKMIGIYLFDAVFSLITYLIFIPIYGALAASILTVMTEAIITVGAFWLLSRQTGFRLNFKIFGKSFLASVAMAGALLLLINQNILTLVLVGGIVYLLVLYLLRGYRAQDLREMIRIK